MVHGGGTHRSDSGGSEQGSGRWNSGTQGGGNRGDTSNSFLASSGGHFHHTPRAASPPHHRRSSSRRRWWRWQSRRNSSRETVVIVNQGGGISSWARNDTRNIQSNNSRHRSTQELEEDIDNEDCCGDDCCWGIAKCCCLAICCCCCKLRSTAASVSDVERERVPLARRPCWRSFCYALPWVFLSIVICLLLIATSSVHGEWVLNAGESRQLVTSFFTESVHIETHAPLDISVYALPHCPPLNGPTITTGDKADIRLQRDDYQYDYFYLNAGSHVDVSVQQLQGASDIVLLRGKDVLQMLEKGEVGDDWYEFIRSNQVAKRYASANGHGNVHFKYKVRTSDTFILLYDNASFSTAELMVDYVMEMTTYNVDGSEPVCMGTCTVPRAKCILVQANGYQDMYVWVDYTSSRRWDILLYCSGIPLLIGLLRCLCKMCCNCRNRRRTSTASTPVTHAPPPPTNPMAEPLINPSPSAPPDPQESIISLEEQQQEYEALPITTIPPENVIPVPTKG